MDDDIATTPQDIYDRTAFLPKDYRWNKDGLSLAKTFRRCAWGLYAVLLVLLCADLWWSIRNLQGLSLGAVICTLVSVLAFYLGLSLATSMAFGNRSLSLSADARHDYTLYLCHKARSMNGRTSSRTLVLLAQLDVARSRPDLARMALAKVDTSLLETWRLKLYYLVQLALHTGDTNSAQTWYDRYTGIDAAKERGFPGGNVAHAWISGTSNVSGMNEVVANAGTRRQRRAIVPALYGAMLAHCIFFLGVWLGVDQQAGWQLRIPYEKIGGYLTSLFVVVLTVVTLVLLWRHGREANGERRGARGIVAAVARVVVALVMTLLAGYVALLIMTTTDGTERTLARGVMEDDRSYTYLAVDWHGYGGTSYYRASDPILMEFSSLASRYDNSDGSDTTTPTGRPTAETTARQNQMRAVYAYLESQGTLTDPSLSFGADANGTPYAVVSTGTEDIDGTAVSVEHRLYDHGEAVNASQVVQEEFVLEKCYPNDERERELEGFYLVDMVSLEVTDEHRTTW